MSAPARSRVMETAADLTPGWNLLCSAFDQAAEGAHVAGGRGAAPGAPLELLLLGRRRRGEQRRRLLQESEVEGVLRSGRLLLDGVERLLVPQVAVARRHRAFLHLVVDARQHAVGGRFALAETHEGLHLAHEAVARRQDRQLTAEVLR